MSKIKVALCLSGEPRSSMFSFPYIYENCINLDPEVFEVDTYSYSFKGFRALPLYNCKKYVVDNRNGDELFHQWFHPLEKNFNSKSLDLLINTSNGILNNQNGIKNLFLMYLNIYNCFNLIQGEYDIYIRARHDIIFQNKFFIEEYISKILSKDVDIYVPKGNIMGNEKTQLYVDQFAIGNYKGMSYYSNLINSLLDLINENVSVKSEILLHKYLNNNDLKISKSFLKMNLVRSSFINSYPPEINFLDQ